MKTDQEQIRIIFSENLKRYMEEQGVTQMDLMNALDLNSASISSYVNGKYLPRMSKITKLCEYFHCEPSDLLTDKKDDISVEKINDDERHLLDMYRRLDAYGKELMHTIAKQEYQRKVRQNGQ